ncbi:MAG: alpha-2-macroglobulin family protein [Patescibacteria group bacterium]
MNDFDKKLDQSIQSNNFDHHDQNMSDEEKDLLKVGEQINRAKSTDVQDNPQFKDKLFSQLMEKRKKAVKAIETKETTGNNYWSSFINIWRTKKWVPAAAGLMLVVLVVSLLYWLPGANQGDQIVIPKALAEESFELKATKMDSAGIDVESDFSLTAKVEVSLNQIKDNLAINPAVDYKIDQTDSHNFLIDINNELTPNQIYQITLQTNLDDGKNKQLSWAYQVKDEFKVISTIPANNEIEKKNGVPADTGIEITFSHANFTDWESHWQMWPETSGYFEKHNNTLVFVPDSLNYETYYKITIDKDFGLSGSSQTLGEDYTLDFMVGTSEDEYMYGAEWYFEKEMVYFSPLDTPAVSLYAYGRDNPEPTEVPARVYQLDSYDKYLEVTRWYDQIPTWASQARQNNLYDTGTLTKVMDFTAPLSEFDYQDYLVLPDKLAVGYYLLEAELFGEKHQLLMQITNLDSYVSITRTQSIVWVADLTNPAAELTALVKILDSNYQYTSDNQGLAVFDTPAEIVADENYSFYLQIEANDQTLFLPINQDRRYYYGTSEAAENYWHYLYLDREVYHPSDKLSFWGTIKPRSKNDPVINELQLKISKGMEEMVYQNLTVNVNSDGYFSGEIDLDNYHPDYYYFELTSDDITYLYESFSVEDYIKPAYKIEIQPEKILQLADEPVRLNIQTIGFENTPIPNVELKYSYDYENYYSLTTDKQGQAQVSVDYQPHFSCLENDYYYGCYDDSLRAEFTPTRAEEGQIAATSYVTIVPSALDLAVDSQYEKNEQQLKYTVQANWIDFDRCNLEHKNCDDYEGYAGEVAANRSIKLKLIKDHWEKTPTDKSYDYINKRTIQNYDYNNVEEVVEEVVATTDEQGKYEYVLSNLDQNFGYRLVAEIADDQGRINKDANYFNGYYYGLYSSNDSEYLIVNHNKKKGDNWEQYYDLGEKIDLEVVPSEETEAANIGNEYLFTLMQNGLQKYNRQIEPNFSFDFTEDHIPNVYAGAVVFDGQKFSQATFTDHMNDFRFNYESKNINFEIKTDKEVYEPGDEVVLDITSKDNQGQSLAANNNISLVDEAYYQLYDTGRIKKIASNLYEILQAGILAEHVRSDRFIEWEKQLGGGGGMRDDFADVALFTTLDTDKNGHGQVKFTLPDNITSWRINLQGINEDNYAGWQVGHINVTKDIYVDYVLNNTYLVNDQPVIQIRTFGQDLKDDDQLKINIKSDSLKINDDLTATAGEIVDWIMPALSLGEHDLVITVDNGRSQDAVKRTFKVMSSYYSQPTFEYYDLSNDLKLTSEDDSRVDVQFYNKNAGEYYYQLNLQYQNGDRIDQKVARNLSMNLLNEYFGENNPVEQLSLTDYQSADGGLSLLPYSSSDLELSAKLSGLLPNDSVNKQILIEYFNRQATSKENNTAEVIQALYGLASLGQPVLTNINYWVGNPDISTTDRLYLALAAERLGAAQLAYSILNGILTEVGQESEQVAYLEMGNEVDNIETTALATVLAGRLDHPHKEKMWNYIDSQYDQDVYILWDKIDYIYSVLTQAGLDNIDSSFEYLVAGQKKKVELTKGDNFGLSLSKDELSQISFTNIQGEIAVILEKESRGQIDTAKNDEHLGISRGYYVDGQPADNFSEGDLIEVRIYPGINDGALQGSYEIRDILPSGLKPVTRTYPTDPYYYSAAEQCQIYYPYDILGQKVSLLIWDDWRANWCGKDYISYFARVSNKGQYQVEPVTLYYSDDPSIKAISAEAKETIGIE